MHHNNPRALSGLRVLDLSRILAGPWATQILGDLGAEVIKVEHPQQRDSTRSWGPPFLEKGEKPWDAAYYFCINRNKKTIAVDFSQSQGQEIIRKLALQADILVENYKFGTLKRYGLDYDSLKNDTPRLIYCSVTGFGQTGPYATRGGYDFLIQGMSGLMSVTGRPDNMPGGGPIKVGIPASDLFCSLYTTTAILAALNYRHESGQGQYIDASLLDTQVAVLCNQTTNYMIGGEIPQRLGNTHPNVVPYRDFATLDGAILLATGNDRQYIAFCRLLGRNDLADDPQLQDNLGRYTHRKQLETELEKSIAQWKTADILAAMVRDDVPGGPINTIPQVLDDPQINARGLKQTIQRPDGSEVPFLGFPIKLSKTPADYRLAPGRFGQDTKEVLQRQAGLSDALITQLIEQKIIATK